LIDAPSTGHRRVPDGSGGGDGGGGGGSGGGGGGPPPGVGAFLFASLPVGFYPFFGDVRRR